MDKEILQPIVYYGGTFDPIHIGHLNICKSIAYYFNFQTINILPNHIPPHRQQPVANVHQRIAMIELAIKNEPLFTLDTRELLRDTYSYTIDTLIEMRHEFGSKRPILFIIGEDSLYSLNKWHQWENLLNYCHLIVCKRNHEIQPIPDSNLNLWIESHLEPNKEHLLELANGKIFLAPTPYFDVSATLIRNLLKSGKSCDRLLPSPVYDYIKSNGIYKHRVVHQANK
ncbi:nicotinate-nucleotide adenylyltransferase [Thorsellia kenyensis]|uniref:Probable nicotinate-nucleotide adenylyltransferase n=1 Tax=Thorsellia kenyensis TaxID=1549888 RepID=A0ABV6CA88_9GAMM